ncbi:MAG: pilin [archaeon]
MNRTKIFCMLVSMFLMLGPMVFAADGDMDKIKEPIDNLIMLVQYIISGIAILALFYAAFSYMTSGSNTQSREGAKNIATGCVIGLLIVWIAPFAVSYLTAPGTGGM